MILKVTEGPQVAGDITMVGTFFDDVNMRGVVFEHGDLSHTRFSDINMSNARFKDVNWTGVVIADLGDQSCIGGAHFKHTRLEDEAGESLPMQFDDCDLTGSTLTGCTMQDVELEDCETEGMVINGIPLQDLLDAYHKKEK